MNKRFASLAVSALLLVSMFSVPALAEGADTAADTAAASDDHVIVTLNPEAALQPETPADAEASATETAKADPDPSAAEAAVSEEKEDKQLTYVALGDSILPYWIISARSGAVRAGRPRLMAWSRSRPSVSATLPT